MAVEFWLSFNSGAEKLRLPVNPPSLNVQSPFGNTDVDISQFGEFTIIGERGATDLSFDAFFPREYNASYCEYTDFPTPAECVRTIERWRNERKPLRLVVTGTDVNLPVTIRDFSYEVQRAGSPGDIYYSMSLREYRFLNAKTAPIDVTATSKKAPAKVRPPVVNKGTPKPAQSYVIKSGDTLSKAFGKDWRKVYEANRKVIGSNPNAIKVGQKLVIPK